MECVKVALRIRPLVDHEIEMGCKKCVQRVQNEPQVIVGKNHQMFTYNYVFDELEGQNKVYDVAVMHMIDNLFKGYNVTILAYGQTGSGKTYTMGTNYCGEGELGVIPRAVYDIFSKIKACKTHDISVTTSFIELYNECLYDLLTQRPREQSVVEIRDHGSGNGICIPGLTEQEVASPEDTLSWLREGSTGRVTGATNMNAQSSRSHAIFTISFKIVPKDDSSAVMTSKFHLVDLAGSERSKKTGATGDRFREGVNINKGLLNLGNVIQQLCEGNGRFINYRDSKLTRLLQDSLGGNSVTLMIACVSPADYNQDETVSTLRYADRARRIQNKPVVNQDPRLIELINLRKENEELRLRMIGEGKAFECPPEHKLYEMQLSEKEKKIRQLTKTLSEMLDENTNMMAKALSIESADNKLRETLGELLSMSEGLPEDHPNWKEFKEKLSQVESVKKAVELEIKDFEKSSNPQEAADHDEGDDEEIDDAGDGGVLAERRNEHILSQSRISKELRTLTKNLLWKEELMSKLTENNSQLHQAENLVASINEMKAKIAELQKEKELLQKQIQDSSSTSSNVARVSENRRLRLAELEAEKAEYRKKLQEKERLLKMKEKSDEKIAILRQEISSMKQMKVKLVNQMKAENEKFKAFRLQKEKEVCKLKNQNIKKDNQLKRLEQQHMTQQNVLRRKLEAAAAANKRIVAALDRQKAVRDWKMKGSATRLTDRLKEELELIESEHQARKSLQDLLQDRTSLNRELAAIKESLDDENISEEEKLRLRNHLAQIEQELEFRSAEISDLQQKLLDIQQDDRARSHWDSLQSMADAKFVLHYLFNLVSDKIKENLDKETLLSELKDSQTERDFALSDYQMKLMNLENYHKRTLEKMEKECEEKVYIFMKMAAENLENSNQGNASEAINIQLKEFEKLEQLRKRIKELEEENARLSNNSSKVVEVANHDNPPLHPFEKFLEERLNSTFVLQEKQDGGNSTPENDIDNDFQITPIHKRIHFLKGKLGKRTSNNNGRCECLGTCAPECNCSKTSSPCNENCSCDKTHCSELPKRPRFTQTFFGKL